MQNECNKCKNTIKISFYETFCVQMEIVSEMSKTVGGFVSDLSRKAQIKTQLREMHCLWAASFCSLYVSW